MKDFLLNLLFPRNIKCIQCNNEIDLHRPYSLCSDCFKQTVFLKGKACKYCGRLVKSGDICLECEKNRYYFTRGYGIMDYNEASKKLLFKLKNHKKTYIAYYYAQMIYDKLRVEEALDFDCITYVPSSREKYNVRGFNPAERIAKHVSKYTGLPYKKLLHKNKKTVAMKNLNRMQRKLTVKNTFELMHQNLNFKKILLIDDVFTTGATINECSKVLYENYLCEIITVTVYVGHRKT